MKRAFWRITFLAIMTALILAAWKFSFGFVWDVIGCTIILAGIVSNWVVGRKMRNQIRDDLGRKATDLDLASIKTWIAVDEKEEAHRNTQSTTIPMPSADIPNVYGPAVGDRPSMASHAYANLGNQVVPRDFAAGKFPYALMVAAPALLVLMDGPNRVMHAAWVEPALAIYAACCILCIGYLSTLKLAVRPDGISYKSVFRKPDTIAFSEISSATMSGAGNFVITPKPETNKSPINISLLLFPMEASKQLTRLLKPEKLYVAKYQ